MPTALQAMVQARPMAWAGRLASPDSSLITVVANKSISGVGSTARIDGGGLQLGSTTRPGNNVIIRNLVITKCPDDCINVQSFSHHVWIDHNDISQPHDGALDIKRSSDCVTVSWNRFHDTDKNMLVVPMIGIGIAWASILTMPYAILAGSLPAKRMGYFMGLFNFFVVIPQIVSGLLLGFVTKHLFDGHAVLTLVLGGVCMLIAALLTLLVTDKAAPVRAAV